MPGTAKHSCLGSRTIFSVGAFKEMILAPVKRSLWSALKSLLLAAEQDQVSHSWVKLKSLICTFPTWLKRERIDFLLVHSSGSEETQILIIKKKKSWSWGFLIPSSECLWWSCMTEGHLMLSGKGWELAAEDMVYPLGSVFVGGHDSL